MALLVPALSAGPGRSRLRFRDILTPDVHADFTQHMLHIALGSDVAGGMARSTPERHVNRYNAAWAPS